MIDMKKFEYLTLECYGIEIDDATFNEFGKDGWELVCVNPINLNKDDRTGIAYFKKEISHDSGS